MLHSCLSERGSYQIRKAFRFPCKEELIISSSLPFCRVLIPSSHHSRPFLVQLNRCATSSPIRELQADPAVEIVS